MPTTSIGSHGSHDLLNRLRREWRRYGCTPDARRSATAFALRHDDLALVGVRNLSDIVDILEPRGGRTVEQRAEIIQALLEDAADPLLHRTLLQTMLPGVVSVARQLQFGKGIIEEPSEVLDMAIATLSELIVDWAGQSRAYAGPDLLSALRGRVRRWLLKEKNARIDTDENVLRAVESPEASPLVGRLAAMRGGPHDRLARLTYERVFAERALKDLAAEDRSSPQSLQVELQQFATRFLL